MPDNGHAGVPRWLLLRRISQTGVLLLFLAGPWWGIWVLKGDLAASELAGTLPLADPFILLQSFFAGHIPETRALLGALVVGLAYGVVGGRVYCSWVCPINVVTDAAAWLRRRLGIPQDVKFSKSARYWLVGVVLLVSLVTGSIAWELVNPITLFQRGLVFGLGLVPLLVLAIFGFDLLIMKHGWCGHVCPVGAFYGLLGSRGIVGVAARRRTDCTRCGDCFEICPEPQVISGPLYGAGEGKADFISDPDCLNCGRCIDVCPEQVFRFVLEPSSRWTADRRIPLRNLR